MIRNRPISRNYELGEPLPLTHILVSITRKTNDVDRYCLLLKYLPSIDVKLDCGKRFLLKVSFLYEYIK